MARVEAVDMWTRLHYRYRPESVELIRTPDWMLNDWDTGGMVEGDCDDIATFLGAIMYTLGYHSRFMAIRTKSDVSDFLHVFLQVLDFGRWVNMDPVVPYGYRIPEYGQMVVDI
jgi:hypothetical protein